MWHNASFRPLLLYIFETFMHVETDRNLACRITLLHFSQLSYNIFIFIFFQKFLIYFVSFIISNRICSTINDFQRGRQKLGIILWGKVFQTWSFQKKRSLTDIYKQIRVIKIHLIRFHCLLTTHFWKSVKVKPKLFIKSDFEQDSSKYIKFIHSEKATKFCQTSIIDLTVTT